jgi:putative transposase
MTNTMENKTSSGASATVPVLTAASSGPAETPVPIEEMAVALMERARQQGVALVGPGGLLQGLAKTVIESALEAELTEHVGYQRYDPAGYNSGNSRNGTRSKTVVTDIGPLDIEVPRDRDGSFEPQLVRKRQRRLGGVDALVCSLSAKGLTHGEICAHLKEIYGAEVSKETITRITDRVMEGMAEWQNRPLDRVYPVIFIDAIVVKIREGQVANRPIYVALGVTGDGERDILGLWAGDGGEGAKYWHHVLTEIKNRGVADCCIVVCDGLTGLPDSVASVWPQAIVQTCVIHYVEDRIMWHGGERAA